MTNVTSAKCQALSTHSWLQQHLQLLFPRFQVLEDILPCHSYYKLSLQAAAASHTSPVT